MPGPKSHYLAVFFVLALIPLLAYGLVATSDGRSIDEALSRHTPPPAPAFDLPLLETDPSLSFRPRGKFESFAAGGSISSGEIRGHPLVLNFWASWCGPCRHEAPMLERSRRKLRRQGVVFVGLDMEDDLPGEATQFAKEFNLSYPIVRDAGGDVADGYGVRVVPETFFVDAGGNVVAHSLGALDATQLRAGVEAAVKGKLLGTFTGDDYSSEPVPTNPKSSQGASR